MSDDDVLTPEQEAAFQRALLRLRRRRQIQLTGYVVSLVVIVFGVLAGLVLFGRAPNVRLVGWVFLVPLGLAGAVLWFFGRWARKS